MRHSRLLILTAVLSLWASSAAAQSGPFAARAREALSQPFVGVTTDGAVRSGLFTIESTGVSTAPVIEAARDFIGALDEQQRPRALFPVDDTEWRNWANVHRFERQGVSLAEMTEAQREAAYTLLRASLSAKGYETSRDIMRLNHHLAELVSNFDEYGEHLYWFTLMGEPSEHEPWGWQIDGHHLVINYFVMGDQVVMTPTFMGSEPITAQSGLYEGAAILEPEQAQALAFMQALPGALQEQALIPTEKRRGNNQAEMFSDNVAIPYEGLRADRMNASQREALLEVIGLYVGNMRDGHAAVKMDEVREHLDETYFGWIGGFETDSVFYYRIHSPVLLIEFDHQGPVALEGDRTIPTRRHIHTVVRTPNGNDYGADLLRQHYEAHADDPDHGHTHAHPHE